MMVAPPTAQDADAGARARLDRKGGISAWRQIELVLTGDLERGLLPPGSKLPSEATLADRFGVNKATVRRAIAEMSAKRLLEVRNGLGALVGETAMRYPLDPHTRFRENLLRAGRTPEVQVLAAHLRDADSRMVQVLGCQPGGKVAFLLLLGTSDGRPMVLAEHSLPANRFPDVADRYRETRSFTAVFGSYGLRVRRRSVVIRARPAAADERLHLRLGEGCDRHGGGDLVCRRERDRRGSWDRPLPSRCGRAVSRTRLSPAFHERENLMQRCRLLQAVMAGTAADLSGRVGGFPDLLER